MLFQSSGDPLQHLFLIERVKKVIYSLKLHGKVRQDSSEMINHALINKSHSGSVYGT